MKSQHTVKVIGAKSHEAMWAEIAKGAREETPPDGSMTTADFSKSFGVTYRQAESILRRRAAAGQLATGKFRTVTESGLRSLSYYWRPEA